MKEIYLAAGCFWGAEATFRKLKGVLKTTVGYANGDGRERDEVTYQLVCTGKTMLKETVKVEYDPDIVSLGALLFAFYAIIDTETANRQGADVGTQYQSGIFWTDEADIPEIERVTAVEEKGKPEFAVLTEPLRDFYPAEEYHQLYLDKNPGGYCHVNPLRMRILSELDLNQLAALYERPARDTVNNRMNRE